MEDYDNTIEITYSVFGYDEIGETSFELDVSDKVYDKLQEAEDDGEDLDSDFISNDLGKIHHIILRAIRENMAELAMEPDDGMVEKRLPWGFTYKEKDENLSHDNMLIMADDDDIEYYVELL